VADDYLSRDEQILNLRRETFDVAVIGGGINGAAVARDAAMRGLKVALIDKGDFAGQTSSRSTKLIHGGLRYLPQGQLRLVYDALRERERLSRLTAPHLVRPIGFLFPVYAGRTVPRLALWAGLFVYDLLARTPKAHRHKALSADQVAALEPDLTATGLRGGAIYYDGHGDDSRLTLENALDAVMHGATAANYVALEDFDKQGNRICAAHARDVFKGEQFAIRARMFVNAAGPWVDAVRRMDDPAARPTVRLTKGVHLVFESTRLPGRHSLVLSDGRGRIIFLIRERDSILLGTTDTDYSGEPEQVRAAAADVDYLLEVVAQSMPGAGLGHRDVIASFAGLRALVGGNGATAPSRVSREEMIITSTSGMLSIAGGKLTTHRRIAQRVVDMICAELGADAGESPTLTTPLPGARPAAQSIAGAESIEPAARTELASRYGTRTGLIELLVEQHPRLGEPLCAGCPVLAAEVVHAARYEMACTLEDFMVRRTAMARRYPAHAEAAAPATARLMATELGWSAEHVASEIELFSAALKASREV
jgi:glycerol-3-phosphate dehydrogenase